MTDLSFYRGKRVFVTGHTGFKGTWLSAVLLEAGAELTGYALLPPTTPSLYKEVDLAGHLNTIHGDVRNFDDLHKAMRAAEPEIVFHLAAQPLVRYSYQEPVLTFETNVMGTVNLLEAIRHTPSVRSVVNVTTDKVYENREWNWGYRENEALCGFDPYSNSKSCSELVTSSYRNSFFSGNSSTAISTARSGNVIGGGDYAADRIIPDCIRAASANQAIVVRNPNSIRPYQHVLECISGYLILASKQYLDSKVSGAYNFGPDENGCVTTGTLVSMFCEMWNGAHWKTESDYGPHEANFLKLDCSKAKAVLGWKPDWGIQAAVEKTVEFASLKTMADRVNCLKLQIRSRFAF